SVRRRFRIESRSKVDTHPVGVNAKSDRQLSRAAGVSHPLQAPILQRVIAPARGSGNIQLAILGAKAAAMSSRTKLSGQRHHRSLGNAINFVPQHQKMSGRTIRKMDDL